MAKILVVDDDPGMREFLKIFLQKEKHEVLSVNCGEDALKIIDNEEFDLVITDLKMKNVSGIKVLEKVKSISFYTEVVVMTAYGSVESAVEAMKLGAFDYIEKPFQLDKIRIVVKNCLEKRALFLENMRLRKELRNKYRFDQIIGKNKKMQEIFDIIIKVSLTKSSVLLIGESGTGKEIVARAIHYNSSRRDKPFVVINCGAIPENLLESELFGHVKGAFTGAYATKKGLFEIADEGTVFLDEVCEFPLHMQVKLLRVLHEKKFKMIGGVNDIEVDVRIISATNRNIEAEVEKGNFREDLFYRLNVIQIKLPPLRERMDDIPYLVYHFIEKYSKEMGKKIDGISKPAMEALLQYDYPGNVRELENIIERSIAFETENLIQPASLPENLFKEPSPFEKPLFFEIPENLHEKRLDLERIIMDIEKEFLKRALQKTGGKKNEAAKYLGISFRSIRYKLQKYGLD